MIAFRVVNGYLGVMAVFHPGTGQNEADEVDSLTTTLIGCHVILSKINLGLLAIGKLIHFS